MVLQVPDRWDLPHSFSLHGCLVRAGACIFFTKLYLEGVAVAVAGCSLQESNKINLPVVTSLGP